MLVVVRLRVARQFFPVIFDWVHRQRFNLTSRKRGYIMNAPAIATAAALLLPGYILDKSQYVHACGMCEYVIAYQSLTLLVASTLCITYYILSPAEFANKYD